MNTAEYIYRAGSTILGVILQSRAGSWYEDQSLGVNTTEYIYWAGSWYEDQSLGVNTTELCTYREGMKSTVHIGEVVGMKTNHLV